jgi:hypothetical protein
VSPRTFHTALILYGMSWVWEILILTNIRFSTYSIRNTMPRCKYSCERNVKG